MDKINVELLISLVEARPALWDKTLDIYKDKNQKSKAWKEICFLLNENFEIMERNERQKFSKLVLTKWTHIRDSWTKALKKHKERRKSGSSSARPSRLYVYHEQMAFLKKVSGTTSVPENNENCDSLDIEFKTEDVYMESDTEHVPNESYEISNSTQFPSSSPEVPKHDGNDDNRHLLFFKSILPSLSLFNDDETLHFQVEVLKLLQQMKAQKQHQFTKY